MQRQVKKHISGGVPKEIKGSKERVRTLFLWESEKGGNQWLLTCVIALEMAKEEAEVHQMKIAMEKKNNNYQVAELPEEKEFTINE